MKKGVEEKGMEKAFYASQTNAQLLEFLHSLDDEKLEIDESQKVEVSVDEVIENDAKADFD